MTINPIENEALYDSILLAGVRSPGKVTLSGHDRLINWDVKSGPSLAGASTTIKDRPPIQFTASFYLVKDDAHGIDDLAEWADFYTIIYSSVSGTTPKALDIYHPDLVWNGIFSVCLAKFGGVVHDGKGGQTISITFQEYKPPKKQGGSPAGSKTGKPDPDKAAQDEIDRLTKQYAKTPWQ